MDFTLPPEIEDLRKRTRAFVETHVLPLESDHENFSEHEKYRWRGWRRFKSKQEKPGLGAAIAQGIRRHGAAYRRLGGDL